MMHLCDYGCGREAKYQLKNGKWCCSISYNSCPECRRKNSINVAKARKKEELFECPHCKRKFLIRNKDKHLKICTEPKQLLNFKDCWYQKIYNQIIEKRFNNPLTSGYYEIHHIIPKCLGGTNDRNNLIAVSAREHYICHALLLRIYKGTKFYYKLLRAFICMSRDNYGHRYTSKLYEYAKQKFSIFRKRELKHFNPSTGWYWITNKETGEHIRITQDELSNYDKTKFIRGRKSSEYFNRIKLWKESLLEKEINKQKEFLEKKKLYTKWYEICNQYGYEYLMNLVNYQYSKVNLIHYFRKYVDDFKPQNGKKRIAKK